jgi:hypothetical protein
MYNLNVPLSYKYISIAYVPYRPGHQGRFFSRGCYLFYCIVLIDRAFINHASLPRRWILALCLRAAARRLG